MLESIRQQRAKKIVSVRFRRGSAFSEEVFHQAFQAATAGTILQNAPLKIETDDLEYKCPCGHEQVIQADDLAGHLFVCPKCGATKEIQEAHDIELMELIAETED
jgi:Zn finger protein HypA/HybF involved in hydrogenase expression